MKDVEIDGQAFRRKREEMGLSVRDVENRTGISRSTVSNVETGRNMPELNTLLRLMKFFDLSFDDISLQP
jgi:transcriptional regulator with XRE-family HTH domain